MDLEAIRKLPKVLLHDHLDGGLRPMTVVELAREVGYDRLPTTDPDIAYGTPDMAMELDQLYRMGGLKEAGIAVLAGHEDGLISFGTTIEEAALRMLNLVRP